MHLPRGMPNTHPLDRRSEPGFHKQQQQQQQTFIHIYILITNYSPLNISLFSVDTFVYRYICIDKHLFYRYICGQFRLSIYLWTVLFIDTFVDTFVYQ